MYLGGYALHCQGTESFALSAHGKGTWPRVLLLLLLLLTLLPAILVVVPTPALLLSPGSIRSRNPLISHWKLSLS